MMAYRITLKQAWQGKNFYAMFNYFEPLGGGDYDADALNTHFIAEVLPELNNMQQSGIQNVESYCVNVTNGLSSDTQYLTGGGGRAVTEASQFPAFNCFTFRYTVSLDQYGSSPTMIKRGYNRFVGMQDNDCTGGRVTSTFKATYGDPFVAALLVPKTVGDSTYRACVHRPGTPYRIAQITGYSGVKLGTQNTRKG